MKSLRALLKSFDTEFSIGKPSANEIIASKEKIIDELRADLDACRAEAKSLAQGVYKFEEKFSKQKETNASVSTGNSASDVGDQEPAKIDSAIVQVQREEIVQVITSV